jgi:RHS repeat-associated protein
LRINQNLYRGILGEISLQSDYFYNDNDQLTNEAHNPPSAAIPYGNERIYAYAGNGRITYRMSGSDRAIGSFKAWFIGLPSVVSQWLFGLVASLLIVAFLLPAIMHILARIRKREPTKMPLSLRNRCLSVLIAYVMLIGLGFEQLSRASTLYSDLVPDDWAKVGNSVVYTYDDIGRLTNKDTSGVETETVTYEYNNLDRLAKITTSRGDTVEVVEYAYNPDGIRVTSQFTRTINSVTDEVRTTTYLVDSFNHTGYAQTIEEHRETTYYDGGVPQTPEITDTTYTLGDDVISQYEASIGADHLLYDGHGSTRQLTDDDITNVVVDCYGYDAYGVMLGGNPNNSAPAATSLLYAGEQFDLDAQQYYLRARYYDQNTGRFNRMDSFPGNYQDPQSLHKYLYCHNNPVNAVDPSGQFLVTDVSIAMAIWGMMCFVAFTLLVMNVMQKTHILGVNVLQHPYVWYIRMSAERNRLSPNLLAAIIAAEQWDMNWKDVFGDIQGANYGYDTSIGLGQVRISTAITYNLVDTLDREQVIKRLQDPERNIEAAARYIRIIADIAAEKMGKVDDFDYSTYAKHGNEWDYTNDWTVILIGSEYTSQPWDSDFVNWGNIVLRHYRRIERMGLFID